MTSTHVGTAGHIVFTSFPFSSLVHEREKKSCRIIGSRDSIWGLRMEFVQEYASIYEANRCKR